MDGTSCYQIKRLRDKLKGILEKVKLNSNERKSLELRIKGLDEMIASCQIDEDDR